VPELLGIKVNRVVPELETDQHAVLAGLPAAGEPQRDERVPAAIQQPGRSAVMLKTSQQLKLAQFAAQPRRPRALDQCWGWRGGCWAVFRGW
jgi:hypothetical protein